MKEVSIVVPAIEWSSFTQQCVTACAINFPDATIILVLDSVPFQEVSFSNLVILKKEGSIAKKRNEGVKIATTEFVAFIDSDAYPCKNWLNAAIQILNNKAYVGIVGGPNISPDHQEYQRRIVGSAVRSWLVAGKWNFYKSKESRARYCDNLPSCNWVLRKQTFVQIGGMKEELEVGEDTDFCARLISKKRKIYFHPSVLVYHYDRKIDAYLRQRLVRGAGIYLHLFGNSAQKQNLYTYFLLQPVILLLLACSFPLAFFWSFWGLVLLSISGFYLFFIIVETIKCSPIKNFAEVFILILVGNVLPGIGFVLKAIGFFPPITVFYRNDR